jgi:riboflavin transporter FmnP
MPRFLNGNWGFFFLLHTESFPLQCEKERAIMSTMSSTKTNGMRTKESGGKVGITSIRGLTTMAMLSGIAVMLMYIEFPLWFAPGFYKLDFSEIPVLIGSFALGPVAGIIIEFIKILLNLLIKGTDTAFVGEFANFLIGCSLVIPSAVIYYKMKSRKFALAGLVVGTIAMIVVGSVLNAYVLLPFYAKVSIPMDTLIAMGTKINPAIHSLGTFVLFAVAPFNLVKGVVVSTITLLLYKKVSYIIKGFH